MKWSEDNRRIGSATRFSRPKWACPLGQYHPRQVEHRSRDAGLQKHVVNLAALVRLVVEQKPPYKIRHAL